MCRRRRAGACRQSRMRGRAAISPAGEEASDRRRPPAGREGARRARVRPRRHLPGMQSFEHTPPEARELLSRKIRDLGLRLEGSMLERYVHQLYSELAACGLSRFRPAVYLSDEWACPDREPIIG